MQMDLLGINNVNVFKNCARRGFLALGSNGETTVTTNIIFYK
jgi:hypothetical protein